MKKSLKTHDLRTALRKERPCPFLILVELDQAADLGDDAALDRFEPCEDALAHVFQHGALLFAIDVFFAGRSVLEAAISAVGADA